MKKCLVCDQDVLGNNKLCYMHQKYAEGLISPYFENLKSYIHWDLTFNRRWESEELPPIKVGMSEMVVRQLEDKDKVAEVKAEVLAALNRETPDMSMYLPMVGAMARKFCLSEQVSYEDVYQDGLEELTRCEEYIDPEMEVGQIVNWVKNRVYSAMVRNVRDTKNKMRMRSHTTKTDTLSLNSIATKDKNDSISQHKEWVDLLESDEPTPEEQVFYKAQDAAMDMVIDDLIPLLNFRQKIILDILVNGEYQKQEDMAKQVSKRMPTGSACSTSTLTRDLKFIKETARSLRDDTIKSD